MRKFLAAALIFATLIATACGENESENVDNMNYKKVLVIGIDDEFAPMGFRDEQGKIIGFDVDLAEEAAKRLGVQIEFKSISWDNKEQEITSGNVDLIWNGLDITDKREEYMIFSKPYMDNRQILLIRKDDEQEINSLSDLEEKIVGTQAGSNSEDYINEDEELKNSFAEFKTYRNVKKGFELLRNRELDVLIIDEIAGRYEMIRHPDTFKTVELTIGDVTEFGIGFEKNNVELRDKVQEVFNDMIRDGTAKKISEKWFQADLIKFGK